MNGAELREKRRALGMTQKQLAERLDVRENTVARWERGELTIANPAMLTMALRTLKKRTK